MAIKAQPPAPPPKLREGDNANYESAPIVDAAKEIAMYDSLPPVVREAIRTRLHDYTVRELPKLVFFYGAAETAYKVRANLPADPTLIRKPIANRRRIR